MKNYGLLIIAGFMIVSCSQNPDHSADPVKDGVFIHITESYADP